MARALYYAVSLMYLAVTANYTVQFVREDSRVGPWLYVERTATLLLHLGFLLCLGWVYRELPLVSWYNLLSMLALGLAAVHTLTEFRFRTRGTGAFVFGLALILQLGSFPGLRGPAERHPLLQNPIFGVHVGFALLGYVGFLISALYGFLYLGLYRMLKARRFGRFYNKMPALDLMARMNLHATVVGFLCMTVAIVLGAELSRHLDVPFARDAKFIQSAAAWLLYGLLLAGRYALGWKGRLQVAMSIVCFALTAVSAAAVQVFFPTFHHFA